MFCSKVVFSFSFWLFQMKYMQKGSDEEDFVDDKVGLLLCTPCLRKLRLFRTARLVSQNMHLKNSRYLIIWLHSPYYIRSLFLLQTVTGEASAHEFQVTANLDILGRQNCYIGRNATVAGYCSNFTLH